MNESAKETWGAGNPYEQYVGRWSSRIAQAFLPWLDVAPGQTWADVGCGTGALVEKILAAGQPRAVYAIDRSKGFLTSAMARIGDPRARFSAADAAALPWAAGACHACVSGLVLNFVPDAAAVVSEMARVTQPAGHVAAYVWDYSGGMQMMRYFWDAAILVDPRAAALDQGERFPLCQPEPLKAVFQNAGLSSVSVRAVDIPMIFRDFDDFWTPFLGKQGSAPTYLASLSGELREAIRAVLQDRLPTAADGSIHLIGRAWAARGTV